MPAQTTVAPVHRSRLARRPFAFEDFFHLPEWWPRDEYLGIDRDIRVDEYQRNGELVIRAELPGIDPDKDVELTMDEGALTIRAERQRQETHKEGEYLCSEMRYGVLTKTLSLPVGVKTEKVKATYANGILEIKVPVDKELTRHIPIVHN